jgi:N-acetylmuramoyl-L-alanine amidase
MPGLALLPALATRISRGMRGSGHKMRRFLQPFFRFALVAGLLAAGMAMPAAADPAVTDLRIGVHPEKTRFVIDLTEPVPYRVYLLDAPARVVIDLAELDWRPAAPPPAGGVIAMLRYGRFTAGTSRAVLDLARPAVVRQVLLLPAAADKPVRLVIDLAEAGDDAFRLALAAPPIVSGPDMVAVAVSFPIPPPKPAPESPGELPMIVIDPGHGGVDPGAIGASGLYEKNITMEMARHLRDRLLATGRYRVQLTRDSDTFIRLRDRIAIARSAGADLFLSLHADAHPTSDLRGASVYTLSENASDEEAEALAAQENKADLIAGVDLSNESEVVTGILIDLAQRETKNHSVRFARLLIDAIADETYLLRNSHRFAGFAVLKAPDVPSVLVELGYLSNPDDEALLHSEDYQAKLAQAIVEAVDAYFGTRQTMLQP